MSNGLTRLLFEDLSLLLLADVAALAVVIGVHRSRMTRQTRRMVWSTLAVCVTLIGVQRWVVTDREAIRATVEAMARDVTEGEVGALGEKFDERITLGSLQGRQNVLTQAHITLQRYDISNARVSGFHITIDDGQAQVRFQAVADVRGEQGGYDRTPLVWDLTMVRSAGHWKVLHAKYAFGLAALGG